MSGALQQLDGGFERRTKFTTGALYVERREHGMCTVLDDRHIPLASMYAPVQPNGEIEARANAQLFMVAHRLHAATHRLTFLLSSATLVMQDTHARKQIQDAVEAAQRVMAEAERLTP